MLAHLINFDFQLTNLINSIIPHNQFFDYFFSFFSLKGSSFLIWILIIIGVIVIEEIFHPGIQKRDIKFVFYFLLIFILTYFFSDLILKNIIQRPRPSMFNNQNGLSCPKDYSLPSTHATTAFTSATVLSYFDKKRGWFYYSVAFLIGLSRIYLSCHYFFDVLIGGIFGIMLANLMLFKKKI